MNFHLSLYDLANLADQSYDTFVDNVSNTKVLDNESKTKLLSDAKLNYEHVSKVANKLSKEGPKWRSEMDIKILINDLLTWFERITNRLVSSKGQLVYSR